MKWETRTICTFIAASVPVEKAGDVSPLMDAAMQIGLDGEQQTQSNNDVIDFDPENPPMPAKENSLEAFMGSFGAPHRWAGAN